MTPYIYNEENNNVYIIEQNIILRKYHIDKGPEQTLLQGGHTEGPETYERMLNITNHQRDEHSNHNEIPLHTGQNGHQTNQ